MTRQETRMGEVASREQPIDPFIAEALGTTADALVCQAARVGAGDRVLLWFDELEGAGSVFVDELHHRSLAKGAGSVSFFKRDLAHDAEIIPTLTPEEIDTYFQEERALINAADIIIIVRGPKDPEAMSRVPAHLLAKYEEAYSSAHQKRFDWTVRWTLFSWPTDYDAKKEGMDYDDYFRLVMEACHQPWEKIHDAQDKLIETLDKGTKLELIANDQDPDPRRRTHLTMSTEGMTFANSTILRNYPGSEVFSAPVIDSVNGQLFAPGEYMYEGLVMRDIFFRFENGKIVEASASSGNDNLQDLLGRGEGARYLGEVALGTNPGLIRRFFHPLLNEKVSGSFHVAIGHCYTYEQYDGVPVRLNNGNTPERTSIHWDLSVLMHPGAGGGKVIVDGTVIQSDGKFVDPELAILNPK